MSWIRIHSLRTPFHLGAFDAERQFPQIVELDITLKADISEASRTDDLAKTVDYMAVRDLILAMGQDGEWKLLEKLVHDLGQEILSHFGLVEEVTIRAKKFVMPDAEAVSVELTQSR